MDSNLYIKKNSNIAFDCMEAKNYYLDSISFDTFDTMGLNLKYISHKILFQVLVLFFKRKVMIVFYQKMRE